MGHGRGVGVQSVRSSSADSAFEFKDAERTGKERRGDEERDGRLKRVEERRRGKK